jgi:hypothetical protein
MANGIYPKLPFTDPGKLKKQASMKLSARLSTGFFFSMAETVNCA